jgi:aryl-alcohol dehydrogenase
VNVTAAVAREGREHFSIEELQLSEPGPCDILVRLVGVGLCHTDVKALKGMMRVPKPIVLGHEGAGIVQRTGARVAKVKPGDHVVLTYDSCGTCRACSVGNPAYCEQTNALNFYDIRASEPGFFCKGTERIHGHFFGQSSFSNYAIARERNTIRVHNDAPLEILGVLGCSVQTGAGAILNSLAVKEGERVAIFGVGPVGLSAVMASAVCGCSEIVAVDVLESRLGMARQLGATRCILAGPFEKTSEQLCRLVPGGVDCALDTTGRPDSYQEALASLAVKGRFAFVTLPAGGFEPNLATMMLSGLSIRGIVQGDSVPDAFIPRLIDLYMNGRFPFDKLVTKYRLEQINQAIEDQASGKVVKPVFTFAT